MKLRPRALVLLGGLVLTLALPSCNGDDSEADEAPVSGRGGTSGAGGKGLSGRAGAESSRGGASRGTGGASKGGSTTAAGEAGDAQVRNGGTGNSVGGAGVGASSAEAGETTSGGHGDMGMAGDGGSAGGRPCTVITGLYNFYPAVSNEPGSDEWATVAFQTDMLPNLGSSDEDDSVELMLRKELGGAAVGTFELGTGIDESPDTCARCLQGIQDEGARRYFATAGTLTFDSSSLEDVHHPHGTLRNVTLREVEQGTLVPGGRCLSMDNADFLVNKVPFPPGWTCGFLYGDGEYCDCGCGALDSDCAGSSVSDCEYCACGNNDCGLVNATENYLCEDGFPPCTALTGLGELSVDTSAPGVATFSAPVLPNLGVSLPDLLTLDVRSDQLGTFELGKAADSNFGTCQHCLTVIEDSGDKRYLATKGTLTFDADSEQMEGYPKGALRNVTLREIQLDDASHSTVLPGGSCLTVAQADLLVNVARPSASPPGWVNCPDGYFGDGRCDCGCGALDVDCASPSVDACQDCNCGNDDCSLVNATQNDVCDEIWSAPCTALTGFGDIAVSIGSAPAVARFAALVVPNFGSPLADGMQVDVYSDAVGSFELGAGIDGNLATCERCVYVYQDSGDKFYLATEGTLTFDASSLQMEGHPHGTLRDVTLREIFYDSGLNSTVTPGGSCLTVADADPLVNAELAPPPVPGWLNCPASYYGDGACDCGCGALDADCASSTLADCLFCLCQGDNGSCLGSSVNPIDNALCE